MNVANFLATCCHQCGRALAPSHAIENFCSDECQRMGLIGSMEDEQAERSAAGFERARGMYED